jgi:OOP family OmpA-OmpF porin
MKHLAIASAVFAVALAAPALAQQQNPPASSSTGASGMRMPYESGFWGHVGFGVGRSRLQSDCIGGFACDSRDNAWRFYGGGRFNNTFGAEVGWLDLGKFQRGGGLTEARGLDLAATAGMPIGQNSSVFLKAGAAVMRTEVSGIAPGLATGADTDWGPRIGIGAQIGLSPQWALRADLDRYRLDFRSGKTNVDTLTVGAQYSFR